MDQENNSFDGVAKPKWIKRENEVPFATKPISVEDTGEFKPLPWSKQNATNENVLVEDETRFDSSLIAGEIKTVESTQDYEETKISQTINAESKSDERKSIFNKISEEKNNQNDTILEENITNDKQKLDVNYKLENKTTINEIEISQSITDTAATLPKIFNENAKEEIQPDFEAPIEINETETTMIRRRSLMGESRQKNEEGYDDTHVRLAWQPLKQEEEKTEEEKLETILEGATVYPTLPSRAVAHWWSIFLSLILLPLSWFFINSGITKLGMTQYGKTGITMGTLEIAGATITMIVFLFATQFSSVGAFVMGTITTVIGALFLFIPQQTYNIFDPILDRATRMGGIIEKIFTYFSVNAYNGTLFFFGLILIFIGFIAHTARRQGRREQQIRNDLGLVGVDDRIAKKARKAALKAEKAEIKAEAKAKAKAQRKTKDV